MRRAYSKSAGMLTVIALVAITAMTGCRYFRAASHQNPKGLAGAPGVDTALTITYMKDIGFVKREKADSALRWEFDCPSCKAPKKVWLWVVPEKKAWDVEWQQAFSSPDKDGWIVAYIFNDDTIPFEPLSINPGDSVYQWVGPTNAAGNDRAIAYYKIDATTGHAGPPMEKLYHFDYCTNPNAGRRTQSAVRDKHPPNDRCAAKMRVTSPSAAHINALPLVPSIGTWISCVGGCCQVSKT